MRTTLWPKAEYPFTPGVISEASFPHLGLNAQGAISGFPAKAKIAMFTIQVTDATGASAMKVLSLQIVKHVSLKSKRLSRSTIGTLYSATLKPKDEIAPFTFVLVGGAPPPRLVLGPDTGQIFGTPTAVGILEFQAIVVSSGGGSSDQRSIRIKIK